MKEFVDKETLRLELQSNLDDCKTSDERNKLGQFATPTSLAREILRYGIDLLDEDVTVRFLDPGIGTGSFYSALLAEQGSRPISSAIGFEVDPHYGNPARQFWADTALELHLESFTTRKPLETKPNLLICNPPYVRHHHLDGETKSRLQADTEAACGIRIGGLAGLYCYFMGLAHAWMAPDAVAGWLIPSEFMTVNYGRVLQKYLLTKVTLLHIHRFDPTDAQFADALVSSAVVWFRNSPPPVNHSVRFTYGGSLLQPMTERMVTIRDLKEENKWTRFPQAEVSQRSADTVTLGDLFEIKRGLATGDNDFFVMDKDAITERNLPIEAFRPLLPGSRYLPTDEVTADENGWPLLAKQLFLLDPQMDEEEIAVKHPALQSYLKSGLETVATRYLCKARRKWYSQENRPPAPIVCTYMGRSREGGRPFRFILNHSQGTALNTYLMLYPKGGFARHVRENPKALREAWNFLNRIDTDELLAHGRVYGGGLHKLEPKELRGYPATELIKHLEGFRVSEQLSFMEERQVA